jgi:hypothetical protein
VHTLPQTERSFVSRDGRRWLVREYHVRPLDGSAPHDVLLFETRAILRWLRDYPRDWHRLSDRELEAISWRH